MFSIKLLPYTHRIPALMVRNDSVAIHMIRTWLQTDALSLPAESENGHL